LNCRQQPIDAGWAGCSTKDGKNTRPLSQILIGIHDYYSGIDTM
jgi:hypothetical protein